MGAIPSRPFGDKGREESFIETRFRARAAAISIRAVFEIPQILESIVLRREPKPETSQAR